MRLLDTLTALGGAASARTLHTAGARQRDLEAAAARGDLMRVRTGWYAAPGCSSTIIRAIRAGGRVGCVSALRLRGAWTLDDGLVHVHVGRGATVRRDPGIRVHWDAAHLTDERVVDEPIDAIVAIAGCLDLRHAVAVTDSALNLGLVAPAQLERRLASSARGRHILSLADGRAESGLETFARLGIRSLRIPVRPQVRIPGVGRVDLVVGDRLVLELDGAAWHADPASLARDRSRDRRLAVLGYVVLRATYHQVLEDWAAIRDQIVALVRRREHLWRTRHPGRAWSGAVDTADETA